MGRYVRQFEVTVTVDEEPVTAVLRQATHAEILSLPTGDNTALLKAFSEKLRDAIVELRGPTDAAGTQIPKDEFLSIAYFGKTVMAIGTKWIERATPQNPPSPAA